MTSPGPRRGCGGQPPASSLQPGDALFGARFYPQLCSGKSAASILGTEAAAARGEMTSADRDTARRSIFIIRRRNGRIIATKQCSPPATRPYNTEPNLSQQYIYLSISPSPCIVSAATSPVCRGATVSMSGCPPLGLCVRAQLSSSSPAPAAAPCSLLTPDISPPAPR